MKNLLFTFLLFISSFTYGQDIDPRILLHYSTDEVLSMDSLKFENIKYYYCDSYSIDISNVENFDINTFDISIFEQLRKDDYYYIFHSNGLIITLIPYNALIYNNNYNKSENLLFNNRRQ